MLAPALRPGHNKVEGVRHAIEAADFNGDGKADILWQHNSGLPVIYTMDGTQGTSGAALPNPSSDWHLFYGPDFEIRRTPKSPQL